MQALQKSITLQNRSRICFRKARKRSNNQGHLFWINLNRIRFCIRGQRRQSISVLSMIVVILPLLTFSWFWCVDLKANCNWDAWNNEKEVEVPDNTPFQRWKCDDFRAAVPLIVSCTAAVTSLSHSVSYITFLFSEWHNEMMSNLCNSGKANWREIRIQLCCLHTYHISHITCWLSDCNDL